MNQRFQKGNVVQLLYGHIIHEYKDGNWQSIDINPELIGKTAVIVGSYKDLYGHGSENQYQVIFQDTGNSQSWIQDNQIELVSEGCVELIDEALNVLKSETAKQQSQEYIRLNLPNIHLSSVSILHLFKIIGHRCFGYEKYGEFYALYSDFAEIRPYIIKATESKSVEELESVLTERGKKQFNSKALFDFFNP